MTGGRQPVDLVEHVEDGLVAGIEIVSVSLTVAIWSAACG